MTIKDDLLKVSMYDSPPENLELAHQRGQMIMDGNEALRQARESREKPPETVSEGAARVIAVAGIHCEALTGMVWKNTDQFVAVLQELGWRTTLRVLDSNGRETMVLGTATCGDNELRFYLLEKPYRVEVALAIPVRTSETGRPAVQAARKIMMEGMEELI